jgi:hypothetical protein
LRLDFLVFHAASATHIEVAAEQALVAEIELGAGEGAFLLAGGDFIDGGIEYAAESPFRIDEEVTGEAVTVVFDDNILAALSAEGADSVVAGEAEIQDRIEISDADFFRAVFVPSVEDAAEEIAVLLWGNGEVGYAAGFGIGLDAGDELEEADFVFDEEVEYLVGVFGVYVVE